MRCLGEESDGGSDGSEEAGADDDVGGVGLGGLRSVAGDAGGGSGAGSVADGDGGGNGRLDQRSAGGLDGLGSGSRSRGDGDLGPGSVGGLGGDREGGCLPSGSGAGGSCSIC
jgi:hypothetical protein